MGTPKNLEIASPRPWPSRLADLKILNVLVALFVLGGFTGGTYALLQPPARSASPASLSQATTTPTATETVVFQSIRVATQAPTRTPQTPTLTPTLTLTPSPSLSPLR